MTVVSEFCLSFDSLMIKHLPSSIFRNATNIIEYCLPGTMLSSVYTRSSSNSGYYSSHVDFDSICSVAIRCDNVSLSHATPDRLEAYYGEQVVVQCDTGYSYSSSDPRHTFVVMCDPSGAWENPYACYGK